MSFSYVNFIYDKFVCFEYEKKFDSSHFSVSVVIYWIKWEFCSRMATEIGAVKGFSKALDFEGMGNGGDIGKKNGIYVVHKSRFRSALADLLFTLG